MLVNNQIHPQDSIDSLAEKTQVSIDALTGKMIEQSKAAHESDRELRAELRELVRIVFAHVTDPGAHLRAN